MNRRGLLKAFTVAPLAAKKVAEEAAASLAGIDTSGVRNSFYTGVGPQPAAATADEPWWKKTLNFLSKQQLPDWYDENLRERANDVNALDIDIAIKKSWSLSYKRVVQRQRNYEKLKKGAKKQALHSQREYEFYKEFGFYP